MVAFGPFLQLRKAAHRKDAVPRQIPSLMIVVISVSLVISGCSDSGSDQAAAPRKPDVIDDAYRLCAAMEATPLTTKCSVRGYGRTVDVTMDTNGAAARKLCAGVVKLMAEKTRNFAGEWKLQIFSPYSGGEPIADCVLI